MKKRINRFFRTYFFFTQQEQKGIRSLLYLLSFLLVVSFIYRRFEPNPQPNFDLAYLSDLKDSFPDFSAEKKSNYKNWQRKQPVQTEKRKTFVPFEKKLAQKKISQVEINTADSATLVSLPGIGPTLASRIIKYREGLGGFLSLEQLPEVYGFKEDLLFDLKERLVINPIPNAGFDINEVDYKTLSAHPYFKYSLSKAILNYRKQHGDFISLEELKKIKIINDSIYNRISIYLRISQE
jgi:competence ComEA-like helix-hairpin-helix protein